MNSLGPISAENRGESASSVTYRREGRAAMRVLIAVRRTAMERNRNTQTPDHESAVRRVAGNLASAVLDARPPASYLTNVNSAACATTAPPALISRNPCRLPDAMPLAALIVTVTSALSLASSVSDDRFKL